MRILMIVCCFLISFSAFAQKANPKKLAKEGEAFMLAGKYAEAAEAYAAAYDVKKNKEQLAFDAAFAYFRDRNYTKALKYFRPISKDFEQWPQAGFFYGKCLKATGNPDKAAMAFRKFKKNYPGDPSDDFLKMADREIEGCEMAEAAMLENNATDLEVVSININSEEDSQFSPLPYSDDVLYFATDDAGTVQFKRSQFTGGAWTSPVDANLPAGPTGHTAQGAFSPDQSAFYFTVCLNDTPWDPREASCELYGTMRNGSSWSTPEKLRDYIKMDGNTACQPTVVHAQGKEWLYYVSDRTGGEGYLDIWYTTRDIGSDSFDFAFPENAGSMINTPGDEFTPFYDESSSTLYFSSNGHANFGGFDIYSSKGEGMKWKEPTNLGLPFNSPTDDYYFSKSPSGNTIYFASNRENEFSTNTTVDNIYQIGMVAEQTLAQLTGRVMDQENNTGIEGAQVLLFEMNNQGKENLMTTLITKEGQYTLPVMTGKNYKLEAAAEGYVANAIEIFAEEINGAVEKDVFLSAQSADAWTNATSNKTLETVANTLTNDVAVNTESMENVPVMASTSGGAMTNLNDATEEVEEMFEEEEFELDTEFSDNFSSETDYNTANFASSTATETSTLYNSYDNVTSDMNPVSEIPSTYNPNNSGTYTTGRYGNDGVTTSAPKHPGSYYKIQISIETNYDAFAPQLNQITNLGRVDTEYIIENGWIRVLLADYFDKDEALRVLYEVRDRGFPEAFLVRYQDGYRKI